MREEPGGEGRAIRPAGLLAGWAHIRYGDHAGRPTGGAMAFDRRYAIRMLAKTPVPGRAQLHLNLSKSSNCVMQFRMS